MMWRSHYTWDPLREMSNLRHEINRVLEGFPRRVSLPVAFLPGRAARSYPLLNVVEFAEGYSLEALAPGLDPSTIDVSVKGNVLTIKGEKAGIVDVPAESFHRSERAAGSFVRTLELPAEIDPTKVEAAYSDGLLRISLPKAEQAKPRQIEVKVG